MRWLDKYGRSAFILLVMVTLVTLVLPLRATDFLIGPGIIFPIRNLTWGASGSGNINNSWYFTPYYGTSESLCVYVYNNNPTTSHNFSLSLQFTGNPNAGSPSLGGWTESTSNPNITAVSNPGSNIGIPAVLGAFISGVAQLAVVITNSSSGAGTPDTADIIIVQMASPNGACGMLSASFSGSSSIPTFQAFADTLGQSYAFTSTTTNPAANSLLIGASQPVTLNRTIYLDKLYINTTAAATFQFESLIGVGTCTTISPKNTKILFHPAFGQYFTTCSVQPNVQDNIMSLPIPANTLTVIDLRGYIITFAPLSADGFALFTTATPPVGTVTAVLQVSER